MHPRQAFALPALAAAVLALPATAAASRFRHEPRKDVTVTSGQTLQVPATTSFDGTLTVQDGGTIAVPTADSLTLTVNGIETGQALTQTGGAVTAIVPGTYRGHITLTVASQNPVDWQGLTFPFRQALYVDGNGVDLGKSTIAAVRGGRVSDSTARDFGITSTGEAFDGVYVAGGDYTLDGARMRLDGNGRSDFVGYGAAIVGTGTTTRLTVDHADISNQGAARTAIIADNGANVIVKNSRIQTRDGVLPADYQPTVDLEYMESAPWMLSIAGNNRATNLLGIDTKATYINDSLASEGWGVLSTDVGQDGQLTAIDSDVANTGGEGGYGSYAIGNATERFLGDRFNVATYATINRGGDVYYGDSTRSAVAQLNSALDLGLSPRELGQLPVRSTVVNSRRFGFMWHGAGTLSLSGGTVVNSNEATLLDKGQQIRVTADGSRGLRLNPRNGILEQVMDNDDPGPTVVDGKLVNQGVYTQPGAPVKDSAFDPTTGQSTDATATFTHATLRGDFYNGFGGGASDMPVGLNMVLDFADSKVDGVISATTAVHHVNQITSATYLQLGEVTNTISPVVNNGVIVTLGGRSAWTVTGTSYLSKLTIAKTATVSAPRGRHLAMTVNGVSTPITPGSTYSGNVALSVS